MDPSVASNEQETRPAERQNFNATLRALMLFSDWPNLQDSDRTAMAPQCEQLQRLPTENASTTACILSKEGKDGRGWQKESAQGACSDGFVHRI